MKKTDLSVKLGDYYYRSEPRDEVRELLKFQRAGTVLDIGAGNGNNAGFLLENGFSVVATETNQAVLPELKELKQKYPQALQIVEQDLMDYELIQKFDVVLCTMVLHFLSSTDVPMAIKKLQTSTVIGGLNILTAYTNQNTDLTGPYDYLFKPNELQEHYNGWQILSYAEKYGPALHGAPHISARLIARKPE